MGPRHLAMAMLAVTALAAGIYVANRDSTAALPQAAFVLPAAESLPEFSLLDQSGQPFSADNFKGQWDLVFFGFTSCPDICPLTLQKLAAAQEALRDAGIGSLPRIVLVSVDPERDTPDQIGRYVAHFGDGSVGITGDVDEIRKLAKSLYVFFDRVELDDGNYTVDHSPAVLVINPDGQYSAGFAGSQTAEKYAADLAIILGLTP